VSDLLSEYSKVANTKNFSSAGVEAEISGISKSQKLKQSDVDRLLSSQSRNVKWLATELITTNDVDKIEKAVNEF
jgi:hypothetical protein